MKNKRNTGITLIALVVTIIVLLILAGISVMMLTGNNGILNKSTIAVKENNHAEVLEMMRIEAQDFYANMYLTTGAENDLRNYFITKGIVDSTTKNINIQRLLGKVLSTGKGTENSDVYKLQTIGEIEETQQLGKLASTKIIKLGANQIEDTSYWVVYYDKEKTVEIKRIGVVIRSSSQLETIEDLLKKYFSTSSWAKITDYGYWGFAEVQSVPEIDPSKLRFVWYETIWDDPDHMSGHREDFNELNASKIVMYIDKWYLIKKVNEELSVKELNINPNEFGENYISELEIRVLITPGYGEEYYFSDNGGSNNCYYRFNEGPCVLDGVTYENGYWWCEWDSDWWDFFTPEGELIKEQYVGDY